jgi:hypothetical protein
LFLGGRRGDTSASRNSVKQHVLVSAAALQAMPAQYVLTIAGVLHLWTRACTELRAPGECGEARARVGRSTAFEACAVRAVLAGATDVCEDAAAVLIGSVRTVTTGAATEALHSVV